MRYRVYLGAQSVDGLVPKYIGSVVVDASSYKEACDMAIKRAMEGQLNTTNCNPIILDCDLLSARD